MERSDLAGGLASSAEAGRRRSKRNPVAADVRRLWLVWLRKRGKGEKVQRGNKPRKAQTPLLLFAFSPRRRVRASPRRLLRCTFIAASPAARVSLLFARPRLSWRWAARSRRRDCCAPGHRTRAWT